MTALLLAGAGQAAATEFSVTIKNTTSVAWTAGLITLAPAISVGATPTSGSAYSSYVFGSRGCHTDDGTCPSGSCDDNGNAAVLAQRLELTLGSTAWTVPALAAGATASVTITASGAAHMAYLAAIDDVVAGTRVPGSEDDVIFMHAVGDATNLSVPLFDSYGMPIAPLAFELGGYDLSSTSASDGTSASCASSCPAPDSGCYVAAGNGTTGATLPAQPAQAALSLAWMYQVTGHSTDGMSLGDVSGSSAPELVVLTEAGDYETAFDPNARGRSFVLSGLNGTAPPSATLFDTSADSHDFMGFPLVENLNSAGATGQGQYLVQEFAAAYMGPGAAVYARLGDNTATQWTSVGYGYPGFWNMGASTGDVRTEPENSGNEVIVPTWSGDLAVLKRDTGESLNTYSFYSEQAGETLYGHIAVGDVHSAAGNELVAFGAVTGIVYVLSANTAGGFDVQWTSTPGEGIYAFGSGPAIADLDGDGYNEIIVTSAGTNKVVAYDTRYGHGCKYQWTTPSAVDYAWTSPVVGDVDGDGLPDVVVMSSNAILSVLGVPATPTLGDCAPGTVKLTHTVGNGDAAWFTPALANLTGGDALDIVVASYTTLEVVDAELQQVALRFSDPTAEFYPSALIERRTGGSTDPAAAIYATGWSNGKVYRLTTPSTAPVPTADWATFMGNNARTGAR